MKLILIVIAVIVVLYIAFATQQKSFKCGYQQGAGKSVSQQCK